MKYCFLLVIPSGTTTSRFLSRRTQKATIGRSTTNTVFNISSLIINARFAPITEPTNAHTTVPGTKYQSTLLFFMSRQVETTVPVHEDNLFVAIALCTGTPANIYAGREINPPPPAIASTNPAKNTNGQTIKNVCIPISLY